MTARVKCNSDATVMYVFDLFSSGLKGHRVCSPMILTWDTGLGSGLGLDMDWTLFSNKLVLITL